MSLTELNEAYASRFTAPCRDRARLTLPYWRQVPLLAAFASEYRWRPGYDASADTFAISYDPGLRVRCRDGELLTFDLDDPAPDSRVHLVLEARKMDVHAWDGELLARSLLRRAQENSLDEFYQEMVLGRIHTGRTGLLAGWEDLTGPLHAVSETLSSLAANWSGDLRSLLDASLTACNAHDDPEISSLLVTSLL